MKRLPKVVSNQTPKPAKKRATKRIGTAAFYLGEKDLRVKRCEVLDKLAHEQGLPNRSVLLQYIADGRLTIRKG